MSANGMCRHNNQMNYCPSCATEKSMNTRGMRRLGMGTMGADCAPGFYKGKIFGIETGLCVPSLSTVSAAATSGVTGSVATGVLNSQATQQAAQTAAGNAIGQKIVNFYKANPTMVIVGGLAVAALVVYGAMSFVRGK